MEPIEFGAFLSFMEDVQLVSVVCEDAEQVDREINVALSAIDSEDLGGGLIETEYQLVLFDALEGGIEISPSMRELATAGNPANLLTATVTINSGKVEAFNELNLLENEGTDEHTDEVNSGELVFVVDLPWYYYDVITFRTRRIQ